MFRHHYRSGLLKVNKGEKELAALRKFGLEDKESIAEETRENIWVSRQLRAVGADITRELKQETERGERLIGTRSSCLACRMKL